MSRTVLKAVFFAGLGASTIFTAAYAASPVKVGQLNCTVSNANKTLFKTRLVLACVYEDTNGNNGGNYQAKINRSGLKLGSTNTTNFIWIVTTIGDPNNVKLAGTYVGANVGVSAGAGAGANYLTGGFNGNISLQPLSFEGKTGVGLELGGQKLVLTEAPAS